MALRKPKDNQDPRAVLLGKVIEYIRRERQLTQGDVFKKCGVSVASISAYERGDRYPKTKFLQLICESLDVDYAILIRLTEPPVRAVGPTIQYDKFSGEKVIKNPAKDKFVKNIDPISSAKKIIKNSLNIKNKQQNINLLLDNFSDLSDKQQKQVFEFIENLPKC